MADDIRNQGGKAPPHGGVRRKSAGLGTGLEHTEDQDFRLQSVRHLGHAGLVACIDGLLFTSSSQAASSGHRLRQSTSGSRKSR
jgi:hypothetical protein